MTVVAAITTSQGSWTGKFYKGLTREMQSPSYETKITYEVGKTYTADDFEVSDRECAPGIHIVTSLAKALKWGPVVVEVSVPEDAQIVCGPDKLRTPVVTVGRVVALSGANLRSADLSVANLRSSNFSGADLTGADFSGADLSGADLSWATGTPRSGMPDGWKLDDQGLWVNSFPRRAEV